ncbi:leishmanolysin [Sphingomonas hankyongi]|uniref:Leishmanolysin n=1 Tax=Sphingomonas hankyongi TaxID=2908209 RepID=A0ABT0RZZ9_9SPHN|nr:leishmanolysin [Sphingomonas hankyongi]MCL6728870.1 leishmanolysin [Sphingomonas hankyongi]
MREDRLNDAALGGGHGRGMDMRPDIPFSTDKIVGIDLTHVIHSDFAAARGGPGGGGGGGGGGGTSFPSYISGAADGKAGFDIQIDFIGTSWTQPLHDVFVSAADRLTSLITADIPDVSVRSRGKITTVDDITITAELGQIDGLYGVLGQAGPTSVRTTGSLPATAQMKFDIVDVNDMGITVFSEVVLHEMAHSLGFGSIWGRLGLVTNGEFTGTSANNEYHAMGGSGLIPVEQDGGSGTAGSHWDEETFGNELMTGYINDGQNYFTAMSAASFRDLGYVITPNYSTWADTGYHLV